MTARQMNGFSKSKGARIGAFLLAGGLAAGAATPLLADPSSDLRALNNRIEKLERDLTDLQRQTYRAGSGGSSSGSDGQAAPANAAELTVRLQDAETSLREMNGRLEELSYEIRQNREQLTRFKEDVEFRFQELEGGAATGAGAAASQAGGSGAVALKPPASAGGNASSSAATGPQTLGTLPQSALSEGGSEGGNAAAAGGAGAVAAAVTDAGSPEAAYDASIDLLKQGQFDTARVNFQKFLELYPDHPLAGNAQYWLGETYYVQGDYKQAADAFLKGYTTYESSNKAPDSLLKLGITLSALGQKDPACATMNELKRRFPSAPQSVIQRAELEKKRAGC